VINLTENKTWKITSIHNNTINNINNINRTINNHNNNNNNNNNNKKTSKNLVHQYFLEIINNRHILVPKTKKQVNHIKINTLKFLILFHNLI